MNIINEMKLKIPGKSVNEGFARSAVAAFAAQLDPTVAEIADIKTAVSEAVTNCIVHAYRDTIGTIYIEDPGIRESGIHDQDQGSGLRYCGCQAGHGASFYHRTRRREGWTGVFCYGILYG